MIGARPRRVPRQIREYRIEFGISRIPALLRTAAADHNEVSAARNRR